MGVPRSMWSAAALVLAACGGKGDGDTGPTVTAIVDVNRTEHFLDWPFPSDAMLDERGIAVLDGFPIPEPPLAAGLIGSWVELVESATLGFGNNTAAYFRFDGPLSLPPQLEGKVDDPVVWIDVETGAQLPIELRFHLTDQPPTEAMGRKVDKPVAIGRREFAPPQDLPGSFSFPAAQIQPQGRPSG